MDPIQKSNKPGISIGIATILIVAVVTFFAEHGTPTPAPATTSVQHSSNTTDTTSNQVPASAVSDNPPAAVTPKQISAYKDGTYTATGSYMSPGGEDQIAVTVTLASDIITDVSVAPTAGDGTSARYQSRFVASYKQYVVGKNIATLNLGTISGSSLTPVGFNNALSQIKAQAKA